MLKTGENHNTSHTWNEIISQGQVWQSVLAELNSSSVVEGILASTVNARQWIFIGCGSSFYLAEAAAQSWTILTGQPSRAIPASEVLLFPDMLRAEGSGLQAVVISRSGRTSEAVKAANVLVRDLHIPTVGITCALASELERECDATIVLRSADEKSTVMTRSFTSMLISLQYLAARTAKNTAFIDSLGQAALQVSTNMQSLASQLERFVDSHSFDDYVFLGQGPWHGIAMEGALKVMEMSCSYSQFFHAMEFRHGPKAIVSEKTCLFFLLGDAGLQAESEVLAEMKALGGVTVAICKQAGNKLRANCDLIIENNSGAGDLALLAASTIPCQLLGFFTGIQKGLNPDEPKNLTRVVILN
ncbi:MAG TPA: SIS domain-containing protein [Candidatus Acidoferrum sp.]